MVMQTFVSSCTGGASIFISSCTVAVTDGVCFYQFMYGSCHERCLCSVGLLTPPATGFNLTPASQSLALTLSSTAMNLCTFHCGWNFVYHSFSRPVSFCRPVDFVAFTQWCYMNCAVFTGCFLAKQTPAKRSHCGVVTVVSEPELVR